MHKALRVVRVFRLFIVILILLSPLSAYAGPASRVLVIHSYHAGFPWTEAIHTGIQHGFGASETEHDLFIEYLDAKRFAPQEFSSDFARYLASKYQDSRIDLLIVSDDNALRFALDYRDTLFRGVPIVFCGIINFDTYENQLPSGITGIAEDIDLASNLSLISRLHGIGTTVAAVADYAVSGSENTRRFLDLINNPQSPRLRYEVFFGYDSLELTSRLNRLPENAVILNLGFWRDRTGSDFNYRESISLLTGTGLPVYSAWDQAIRFGAVGGMVLDVEHQGTAAAEIALRILSGTAPDDIPVIREPQIKPVFNYQALKTHKIQMNRLPAGSSIINKPDTIYFRYPVVFSTIIATLGLLLLLVVLLGINIVQRKQAESLFYSLFHNAPDVIMLFSPDGNILIANKAVEQYYGYTVDEIKNLSIQELDTSQYAAEFDRRVHEILTSNSRNYEVHHFSRDGRLLEFESRVSRVSYQGKTAILTILRNINERNRNQRFLEQSLRENELLLREVHHRVKNNLQIVISLLRLQADRTPDPASLSILNDSRQRINAIAAVHELLYQSEGLYSIDAAEYLESLVHQLASAHSGPGVIDFSLETDRVRLDLDEAIPVGIIVTEFVTNSIKYGTRNSECYFRLSLHRSGDYCILEYEDGGPGFDFAGNRQDTLGFLLVENLTQQLKGNLVHNGKSGFSLRFPVHTPLQS